MPKQNKPRPIKQQNLRSKRKKNLDDSFTVKKFLIHY